MTEDVKCPYCGKWQEINHDDGYGYEEGQVHEQECTCGKTFVYSTSAIYYYEAEKAPCKNGGEHDFKQSEGYPSGYMKNRQRCQVCDEVHLIDDSLTYDGQKDEWIK